VWWAFLVKCFTGSFGFKSWGDMFVWCFFEGMFWMERVIFGVGVVWE